MATTLSSACPKCGIISKSGKPSCCGREGSWFRKCGSADNDKLDYTWYEGIEVCKRRSRLKTVISQQAKAAQQQKSHVGFTPANPKAAIRDAKTFTLASANPSTRISGTKVILTPVITPPNKLAVMTDRVSLTYDTGAANSEAITTSASTKTLGITSSNEMICPKCGTFEESGRVRCCAPGGAWHKNCGGAGNRNADHTWFDGVEACRRKSTANAMQIDPLVNREMPVLHVTSFAQCLLTLAHQQSRRRPSLLFAPDAASSRNLGKRAAAVKVALGSATVERLVTANVVTRGTRASRPAPHCRSPTQSSADSQRRLDSETPPKDLTKETRKPPQHLQTRMC